MVFVKADTLYTTGGEEGRQMLIDSGPDNIRVQGYRIHSRYLKDYYISQTEVTNQLWENVMGEKSFSAASGRDKPVRLASYWEVQNFLQRLNEITGRHYRLPWEAEWEFAARGGRMRKGYLYAGSDYLNEVALHVDNSRLSDGMLSPQPVASKKPNELKLYDMMGNVEEWCLDTTRLTMDEYVVRFGGGYQLLWRSRRRRGGSYKSSPYSRLWHWLEYTIHGDSDGSRPYLNIVRLAYNTDSATQAQCMATILADAEEKISQKESTRCGFRLALSVEEE